MHVLTSAGLSRFWEIIKARFSRNEREIALLSDAMFEMLSEAVIYHTASGSPATFDDGADGIPVKSLIVTMDPVQSGSGTPSPENVRPITGWTAATVTRTGKNLLGVDYSPSGTAVIDSGLVTTREAGSVTISATASSLSKWKFGLRLYYTLQPGTYTLSFDKTLPDSDNRRIHLIIRGTDEELPRNIAVNTLKRFEGTYTVAQTTELEIRFTYTGNFTSDDGSKIVTYSHIQLEHGDTATAYETFSAPQVESVSFDAAGTVYGGTLDVTNGFLTVTHKKITLNGSEDWKKGTVSASGVVRFQCNTALPGVKKPSSPDISANSWVTCSHFQVVADGKTYWGENGIALMTNGNVLIRYANFDDFTVEDFKNLSQNYS